MICCLLLSSDRSKSMSRRLHSLSLVSLWLVGNEASETKLGVHDTDLIPRPDRPSHRERLLISEVSSPSRPLERVLASDDMIAPSRGAAGQLSERIVPRSCSDESKREAFFASHSWLSRCSNT